MIVFVGQVAAFREWALTHPGMAGEKGLGGRQQNAVCVDSDHAMYRAQGLEFEELVFAGPPVNLSIENLMLLRSMVGRQPVRWHVVEMREGDTLEIRSNGKIMWRATCG